jgi:hypothetical protein
MHLCSSTHTTQWKKIENRLALRHKMQLDAPKLKFTGIEDQSQVLTAEMSDFKIVLELNAHHTAGWKKKPQVCGWVRL